MNLFRKERKQNFFYEHDLHSHILPGLDDGVKHVEDSIVIVKKMLALGVKKFSFTPHISFPSPLNTPEIILGKLVLLKGELAKEGIWIDADAGAEYKVGDYMLDLIDRGRIASFQDNCVLIEHSFISPSPVFEDVVFRLQDKDFQPILAHPERYPFYVGRIVEHIKGIKNRGCKIQVNLLSFSGFYGKEAQRGAKELSEAGMIDYVSGDIHSVKQVEYLGEFLMSKQAGYILTI